MAALTWRNVDAPNLAGSQQSLNAAAQLLGNASSGLSSALGQFGDREALARLAQYSDPAALQRDVASGAFDTSNASAATLGRVMARPTNLLENAAAQQQTEHFAALSPLQQQQAQLQNESAQMRNAQQAWQDPITRENFEQGRAATGEILARRAAGELATPAQANALLAKSAGQTVPYQQAAEQQLSALFPGFNAPAAAGISLGAPTVPGSTATAALASAAGTAGTNKGSSYDVVYGMGQGGLPLPPKPVSSSTIGEVVDWGKNVLIPATKGTLKESPGLGTSAVGKYQFTQETLNDYGPKVLGKDWKTQPFNAENQDKLAEALFNDRKGGNLKQTWQGLPNTAAGAYKDIPWSQMKEIISSVESPTVNSGVPNRQQVQLTGATAALANSLAGGQAGAETANRIQAALNLPFGTDTSLATVTSQAIGKGGALEGMKIEDAQSAIRQVMKSTGLDNAAAALELVKNAGQDRAGIPFFNRRNVVDSDQLDAEIKRFKSGDYLTSAQAGNQARANISDTATANAAVDAARTNLINAKAAAVRGAPGAASVVAQAQQEYDTALAGGNLVNQLLQQTGASNANFTPPPARPASATPGGAQGQVGNSNTAAALLAGPPASAQAIPPEAASPFIGRRTPSALISRAAQRDQARAQERAVTELVDGLTPDRINSLSREEALTIYNNPAVFRQLDGPVLRQLLQKIS